MYEIIGANDILLQDEDELYHPSIEEKVGVTEVEHNSEHEASTV